MKVRKCDGRHGRHMRELPFYGTVGKGEDKGKDESLQLGHRCEPLEQSIWMKVGGWVEHEKIECDEVHSSRE